MELFPEQFLQALSKLRITARQVPRRGRPAEHRSQDLGSGVEFCDFRSYTPGDDLRRVDWNLYRRSGRLFMKLFEETEDLYVYVLLDSSDSMYLERPPRADSARRIAAVMAAVSLNQHDRFSLYPFGSDLKPSLENVTGKRSLRRVLSFLEDLGPQGRTDLETSLNQFASLRKRKGLVVVISDFFDPKGLENVKKAMEGLYHHRLLFVQMVRTLDASPDLQGEKRLQDCETGSWLDVTMTPEALTAYRKAYQAFSEDLLNFVAGRRATMLRLDADRDLLEQMGGLFPAGQFVI